MMRYDEPAALSRGRPSDNRGAGKHGRQPYSDLRHPRGHAWTEAGIEREVRSSGSENRGNDLVSLAKVSLPLLPVAVLKMPTLLFYFEFRFNRRCLS